MAPAPTSTITTMETIIMVMTTGTTNMVERGIKAMEDIEAIEDMVMDMLMARTIAVSIAVKPHIRLSTHKASSLTVASMGTRNTTGRPQNLQDVTVLGGKEIMTLLL